MTSFKNNKLFINTFNIWLRIDKTHFVFEETSQPKDKCNNNNQQNESNITAKVVNNVKIKPNFLK